MIKSSSLRGLQCLYTKPTLVGQCHRYLNQKILGMRLDDFELHRHNPRRPERLRLELRLGLLAKSISRLSEVVEGTIAAQTEQLRPPITKNEQGPLSEEKDENEPLKGVWKFLRGLQSLCNMLMVPYRTRPS